MENLIFPISGERLPVPITPDTQDIRGLALRPDARVLKALTERLAKFSFATLSFLVCRANCQS